MSNNLVLLWGWAGNEKNYEQLVDTAPKDWKVYQISYPELIPSGRIDSLDENILKFLKRYNLKKVNLVGHSLGGALALEFASHYKNRAARLFLIDSEGIYDKEFPLKVFWKIITTLYKEHITTLTIIRNLFWVFKNPLLHIRLGLFAHHVDLQKEARVLKVPTTILWGENDSVTPLWQGQRLHQLIKDSKLIILKNQGHNWILNSPELFWNNI